MDEEYEVSSEIYEEFDYSSKLEPTVSSKNVVSKFPFSLPQFDGVSIDQDGDLIVPRKRKNSYEEILEIEHSQSTSLDLVGLQIWRGSLLLADWLLENGNKFLENEFILELGSGVGLASIIASRFCPVICTDLDRGDIFQTISSNISRNKHFVKYPIEIMELDFLSEKLPQKVQEFLPKVRTVIAADVVYDDHISDALLKTIKEILLEIPSKRTIFVALEKRYVFTIKECETSAPCYDYFIEHLKKLDNNLICEEICLDNLVQYFRYHRSKELVLWRITTRN